MGRWQIYLTTFLTRIFPVVSCLCKHKIKQLKTWVSESLGTRGRSIIDKISRGKDIVLQSLLDDRKGWPYQQVPHNSSLRLTSAAAMSSNTKRCLKNSTSSMQSLLNKTLKINKYKILRNERIKSYLNYCL